MKIFHCQCSATLFFESTSCLDCKRELGYIPELQTFTAFGAPEADAHVHAGRSYKKCLNYSKENVCNWMLPSDDAAVFCTACRLNETIPNLSKPENRASWAKIEAAKRRLVYSLLELGLPVKSRGEDPQGLGFAFLENPTPEGTGTKPPPKVSTGHAGGLVTLNIAEADEVAREQIRCKLQEPYRTLLGHFRHESGHYYWDRFVRGTPWNELFRGVFGDERDDYAAALAHHYEKGAPPNYEVSFISAYASSHPWEDWAETWAHYLHMCDTLETSRSFGISAHAGVDNIIDRELFGFGDDEGAPISATDPFGSLLRDWVWLSLAMNSINRSMGGRDAYPFVLNRAVARKLHFVHQVVGGARRTEEAR